MLFSLAWLRSLCPVDADAAGVARALTARGLAVDAVHPGPRDTVLDVDVPVNRPDCLGHRGLARELGAALSVALVPAPVEDAPSAGSGPAVAVEIEAPDLCARYTARLVRGVRVGPSPSWVVERIESCGLRSINNVVDASNLVLLELGQPVHFFDADRLAGRAIRVRRAARGERLRTLDGIERELDPTLLVIADAERPTALAGILGGAGSEIGPHTSAVLVEAAWFRPAAVRRAARALGLRTDASQRFERGTDIEAPIAAQHLAGRLLAELAQGVPDSVLDVYPTPRAQVVRSVRLARIERLLGYAPSPAEVRASLAALSLAPRALDDTAIEVTVPSWRIDLEREEDLVEEVARHLGYDRVPVSLAGLPHPAPRPPEEDPEETARSLLATLGFQEAFGYAMIGEAEDEGLVPADAPAVARLTNPIADPLAYLRRSLLPGLLQAIDANHRRGTYDVRVFEVGRTFWRAAPGQRPIERRLAAFGWSGTARPAYWADPASEVSYPDVAGVVEHVLAGLRPGHRASPRALAPPAFHPGRSATWSLPSGVVVARAGALHPVRQRRFERPVWVAEFDLESLSSLPATPRRFAGVPRLSPVSRDLSLQMPRERAFADVAAALRAVPAPAPALLEVVDRYEGLPLPPGEVSITVRIVLSPDERTLVDAEIETYRQALVASIGTLGGVRLRGE